MGVGGWVGRGRAGQLLCVHQGGPAAERSPSLGAPLTLPPPPAPACSYGTHVLLECARLYGGVRRFINVSTDEVYGESSLGKTEGLKEHSPLEPTNPYSAAKAGAEMMARAYHTSYKLPVIVTRGNNVYGPHQFPEKMM